MYEFLELKMTTPDEKLLLNRFCYDHKISSSRSEGSYLLKPKIIPKRSLSTTTIQTNDEQVSEITSTNELSREYPTCTQSMTRLDVLKINYKPVVVLHPIDDLLKRMKEVVTLDCAHCPKKYFHYDDLQNHLKIHDKPTPRNYPCEELNCQEIFHCKYKLKSHARSHRRAFLCTTCNKQMNLGLIEFQWHESICRGQQVTETNGRVTRSKSIYLRNEESIEKMYEARMELWQRPDPTACDIDPEETKLNESIKNNKQNCHKKRRYSKSASVYEYPDCMDDSEYLEEMDMDSRSNIYESTSVVSKSSKVSKASRASMYSQNSTKSKPISISIRSNYSHISRNEYSHMNDETLVKVRENYVKHRKRTRSISLSLAKVELELVCRSQRKHTRDVSETGVEINNQTKKRMCKYKWKFFAML